MTVFKLTITQKNKIVGQEYAPDSFYNPVQDGNEPPNWVISHQEVEQTVAEEFLWVKELKLIEWVAPEYPDKPFN